MADGEEQAADATRRTRLANERTYLAWWRTGLTAFAVSLGSGKLVPELTDANRWPYLLLGIGFALLGLAFVGYGLVRQRRVDAALSRGEYEGPDDRLITGLTAVGVALGVVLMVVVVVGG